MLSSLSTEDQQRTSSHEDQYLQNQHQLAVDYISLNMDVAAKKLQLKKIDFSPTEDQHNQHSFKVDTQDLRHQLSIGQNVKYDQHLVSKNQTDGN